MDIHSANFQLFFLPVPALWLLMGANSTNAVNDGKWQSHPWQGYGARFPTWRSEFTRVTQREQVGGERIRTMQVFVLLPIMKEIEYWMGHIQRFSVSVNA